MSNPSHALSPLALQAAARGLQTLAPGQALTLRPPRAGVLRVQRGALWVTRGGLQGAKASGAAADEILRPGQHLRLRAGEWVVVEPIAAPGTPLQRVALNWQASDRTHWAAAVAQPASDLRHALQQAGQASVRMSRGLLAWALQRPPSCGEVG